MVSSQYNESCKSTILAFKIQQSYPASYQHTNIPNIKSARGFTSNLLGFH
jgi:hypothetical protein